MDDSNEVILENIVEYIYTGKANVGNDKLTKFLETAAKFKLNGIKENFVDFNNNSRSMLNSNRVENKAGNQPSGTRVNKIT